MDGRANVHARLLTRRRRLPALLAVGMASLVAATGTAYGATRGGEPGPIGDGATRLINQRTITPAGQQTTLGDRPVNAVLSPDGAHLLVVNSGAGVQSVQIVATATGKVEQTIPYLVPDSAFVGAAYSPDGRAAYVSGGGADVVHTFTVGAGGQLTRTGDITIGTLAQNPFPTGIGVSPDGSTLAVANNLANTLDLVDVASRTVTATVRVGGFPYGALFSRDGRSVFVSNWADATVSVVDAATHAVTATIGVGNHPSAMILRGSSQLVVADSNSDAVSLVDTRTNRESRRISVSPYRGAQLSSSPEGLSLGPDGSRLYVADAGADEVSVVQLSGRGDGEEDGDGAAKVLGRIPTAWYPTSVTVSRDGRRLFVTNAKGTGAGPNDAGFVPNPTTTSVPFQDGVGGYADSYCNCTFNNFTASMIVGTLSTVEVPGERRLEMYTDQVARDDNFGSRSVDERSPGNPVPVPGGSSPIKHVIYIIKENRTYDQVFGDLRVGDGAPGLTLFGAANTPNLHALALRFGVLDNFYADAEVSADGHNWATSANASDYNEKIYPQDYSPAVGRNRGYDFEGTSGVNLSPGGYLWDAAARAGLSLRDYGEFAVNAPLSTATTIPASQAATCAGPIATSYTGLTIPAGDVLCFGPTTVNATTPNLAGREDPNFHGYDLRYREADRVAEWTREFQQFEASRTLPALEIMRLPNDHTSGTTPGRPTPQAYVAENDQAVGQVVDTVSHSRDWASTAIFITEDDAQNGPDHVDAHRTESLVVSAYTQRQRPFVDHTLYSTSAMVRTMELILGMLPLSQFDANATPMWRLFHPGADRRPFQALPETIGTSTMSSADSPGAALSATMNFEQEDQAPMDLNQVIWQSVKGAGVPYPGQTTTSPASDDGGA